MKNLYINNRLKDSLKKIPSFRVTTVIAPMGYGKTTAVRWWMKNYEQGLQEAASVKNCEQSLTGVSGFWMSVYGGDRTDFWRGLCAAMRSYPSTAKRMEALGFPEERHSMGMLAEILQEDLMQGGRSVFLVVDDLHFTEDERIPELLGFLAERMPEGFHLILMSRRPVFSPAQRMKLGQSLLEIGTEQLHLTREELIQYAPLCELELLPEQAERLEKISGGWVALVYLIFRNYAEQGVWQFDSPDIYALVEEIFIRSLPERERNFLIVCSIADELDLPMIRTLWGEKDADPLLEDLIGSNSFVLRDGSGIIHYHAILKTRARMLFDGYPEAEKRAVWCRLGIACRDAGHFLDAERAFERAGEWDLLLETLGKASGRLMDVIYQDIVLDWLQNCPPEILNRHVDAMVVILRKLFMCRRIPEMMRLKGQIEAALAADTAMSEAEKRQYQGECLLVMSFLQYNDILGMSALHRKANELMTRPGSCWDNTSTWTFGAHSVLMMFHRESGRLAVENEAMRQSMPCYYAITGDHGYGAEQVMQAETDYLRGDLQEAAYHAELASTAARSRK